MNFRQGPPRRDSSGFVPAATALVVCCLGVAVATAFPWTRVAFERLWGEHAGPLGWQTTTGFTCLTTCLLTAIMAGSEGKSPHNRHAARTAGVMLMLIATIAVIGRLLQGPESIRGVSGAHTGWFLLAAVLVTSAAVTCGVRVRDLRRDDARAF